MKLLVDLMKKNPNLGAACGRIHPVGSAGILYWYQKFEYVIGHWLQKATEHILGCVMCSPGCFSLFRAKALMDDNVMRKYTTKSEEPIHFVQFDQVRFLLLTRSETLKNLDLCVFLILGPKLHSKCFLKMAPN